MAVTAAYENYSGPTPDRIENFQGNQLVYIGWDRHMMFPFAAVFPLPPHMPFGALIENILPSSFGVHPDFKKIDWGSVMWMLDGAPTTPDHSKTLAENGIGHKSILRLVTPSLDGIDGSGF